jgi:hypothetical protein
VPFQWGVDCDTRTKKWGAHLLWDAVRDRKSPFCWCLDMSRETTEFGAGNHSVRTDVRAELVQALMACFLQLINCFFLTAIPAIIPDETVPNQIP